MIKPQEDFKQRFLIQFSDPPTGDQTEAINKISDFIFSEFENPTFILNGYAGTGKTKIIASLSRCMHESGKRTVLLAPTGRAAKVLASYSLKTASTIHRKIYSKNDSFQSNTFFSLAENLHKNTTFIVDEASMIGAEKSNEFAGTSLLEDLIEYVFSGDNCRLILVGDKAQLPPVGCIESPALDIQYLKNNFNLSIVTASLKEVIRQQELSGILYNATQLRICLEKKVNHYPKIETFPDVIRINGSELEDELQNAYSKYGFEDTLIICRSNKRANAFNQAVRNRIRWQENDISSGDLMMAVKNNYFWLKEEDKTAFIANGESIEIKKIIRIKELYGFRFAEATVCLSEHPQQHEIDVILLLDSINTETASLSTEMTRKLFENIILDFGDDVPMSSKKFSVLRKSPYFNALQVKFNYAITAHKSQGGQWACVFIDQGYLTENMLGEDFLRWLYTCFTRATDKLYLINFNENFF